MGGNIFSNIRRVEYPDFTGERAKYEALKHAELQRKLQTQQALQQQAEFGHKQQDWQREDAFRGALGSLPLTDESGAIPGTTLTALAKIDPIRTSTLSEAMAKRAAAVSEARIKAQAEKEHHSKLGFYDFSSAMNIEDPQKRFEHVMSRFDRYEKLGVLEQPELEDLATSGLTPKLIDRVGTRLLGQEEYGKIQAQALTRQEALAKAVSEAKTRPAEEQVKLLAGDLATKKAAGVRLFNANSPEEWDKAINSLPEDERAQWMDKPFNQKNRYKALTLGQTPTEILTQERLAKPDDLDKVTQALNNPDTPREQIPYLEATRKQMIENRIATQPDRLLNPAEFAQALELTTAKSKALQEGKPPSQGEELLAGYAARVKQANQGFENLTMGDKEMVWNKLTPDFLNTEAGQVFAQDERNFINSVLRRESGAAISPPEFTSARAQYIPQPGDSPAVLEKKRRNRLIVQQSLIRGSGRAYVDPDELLRQAGVDVPTLTPGTPPPASAPGTIPSPLLSGGKPSPAVPQGAKPGTREKWVRDSKGVLRKAGN